MLAGAVVVVGTGVVAGLVPLTMLAMDRAGPGLAAAAVVPAGADVPRTRPAAVAAADTVAAAVGAALFLAVAFATATAAAP